MEIIDTNSRWFRSTLRGMQRELEESTEYDNEHPDYSSPHNPGMAKRLQISRTLRELHDVLEKANRVKDEEEKKVQRLRARLKNCRDFAQTMKIVCEVL